MLYDIGKSEKTLDNMQNSQQNRPRLKSLDSGWITMYKLCVYLTGPYKSVGSKVLINQLNKQTNIVFIIWKRIRIGSIDGTPLGTGKTIVFLYLKNNALGMPDGAFLIIYEKPFFNLNL